MLKKNLLANYLGQGWVVLMGLAFIPTYIKYLGIEAYGLIGLFAVLQAWLSLLDMGLTPALSREMARMTKDRHSSQYIHDLLRSTEVLFSFMAVIVIASIWGIAPYLAMHWLNSEIISLKTIENALIVMGIVTALRLIENIYRSSIIGLQKQVIFNVINSSMATLRGLGSVGVLVWISPTIDAFFVWQGVVSLLSITLFAVVVYKTVPLSERGGRFSFMTLKSIQKFAGGMLGITFLSLLLMQVDKIILSRLLSLSDYGYYSLAVAVAATISMFLAPIGQAWFPKLSALQANGNEVEFIKVYHQGSQLISVVVGTIAIILIFFSQTILQLWTHNVDIVSHASVILSLLVLGNFLNGLMWMPYQAQLAHGWTSLTLRINIVSVIIIVPVIFLVTPYYGAEGAAWIWVGLNASYVLAGIHFMYRKILTKEKWKWYIEDILFPLASATSVVLVVRWLAPQTANIVMEAIVLIATSLLAFGAAMMSASHIREQLMKILFKRKLVWK